MDDSLVRLDSVSFAYPGRDEVLSSVDFSLRRGEKVGIVGPNGSGKTTLLHLMVGLLRPASGRIFGFGREMAGEADFRELRKRVGLLFQDADDQLFCPTVAEDVAFGPLNLGRPRERVIEVVERTLATLGLEGYGGRITHNLSGGEKKLAALATVLAMEPEVLLLDEPFAELDEETVERIIGVLGDPSLSLVIISHNRDRLERTTTAAYRLEDGALRRPGG